MDILGPFPLAPGQLKLLIIVVDYFTKWIEEKVLANITATNVLKLFKRNVLARYEILLAVVTDKGSHFPYKNLKKLLEDLKFMQHFMSLEQPHINGWVGADNLVVLRGLKRRFKEFIGNWDDELRCVLLAYQTMYHSATSETRFWMTYRTKVGISIKLEELIWRTLHTRDDLRRAKFPKREKYFHHPHEFHS